MIRMLSSIVLAAALATPALAKPVPIEAAAVYPPAGSPKQLVIFLSGDGGWNAGVVDMAKGLAREGAMVVGVNTPNLLKALDASAPDTCSDAAGALSAFAAAERKILHVDAAVPLVLAGYSSGATVAYIAHAALPANTATGSLVLGFCPDLENKRPICGTSEVTAETRKTGYLYSPARSGLTNFTVMQGMQDQICEPNATIAFVGQIPGAKLIQLPKVGHGYGVEKNWMPQFLTAYREITGSVN